MPLEGKNKKKKKVPLDEACERYKVMYEASTDAIMTLEPPAWKFTSGNPATVKIFNTKDEKEFISLGPWEVSPEFQPDGKKSMEKAKEMIEKAMKDGSAFFDWTHKRYKGESFPATVLLTKFKFQGRDILEATVRDISKQKEVENKVILHNEIVRNMSEGVYFVRLKDGIIVYTNPKFEKMFGYNQGEMVGKNVSIVNAPARKKPEETAREITDVLKKTGEWFGEINNIKKDGTVFWCYASCFLFDHPEYGRIIVAMHTDITERKMAEEKTKKSEKKYHNLYDSLLDGIVLVGMDGKIIECNKAYEKMTGYNLEELKKTSYVQLTPKKWHKLEADIVKSQILKKGYSDGYEKEYVKKNGEIINIFLKVWLEKNEKKEPVGMWGIIRDITQQKKEKEKSKEQFEEMQKINKLMIGRELKMIELKEKLAKFEGKNKKNNS